MKKSIITLSLIAASFVGFSQSFSYELKSWALNGSPSMGADSTSYPVIVVVGIVGEPYGFLPSNPGSTCTFIGKVPNKGVDTDGINASLTVQAASFVKQRFPDVK